MERVCPKPNQTNYVAGSSKVAVLITGQLRTAEATKATLKRSFPGADFFLSIDKSNLMQCANLNSKVQSADDEVSAIVDYFQPVKWYSAVGPQDDYRSPRDRGQIIPVTKHSQSSANLSYQDYLEGRLYESTEQGLAERLLLRLDRGLGGVLPERVRKKLFANHYLVEVAHPILFAQYYFVDQAFRMLRQAEAEGRFRYSTIVRVRFDQILFPPTLAKQVEPLCFWQPGLESRYEELGLGGPLWFDDLQDDEVVVFGHGHHHHYYYVNDQHFVVNASAGEVLERFYRGLHQLILEGARENRFPTDNAAIEHFFAVFLATNHLRLRRSSEFNYEGLFVRRFRTERAVDLAVNAD